MALFGRYEVAVYNVEVRRLVYQGEHHKQLNDEWSSTHYIEVQANSSLEARRKIEQRYPRERGFVIEAVKEA